MDGGCLGRRGGCFVVAVGVRRMGGSIDRREGRDRECGVSLGRSPGGIGVRGGRCLRWGQEGLWKGWRSESSERDGRAGRESLLW